MRCSAATTIALAAILSAGEARPHEHQGASGAVGDSGNTNSFMSWLSSLMSTESAGNSESDFPDFDGDESDGFGNFPTATGAFPTGIFPTDPASAPTGGPGGSGYSDGPFDGDASGGFGSFPTATGAFPSGIYPTDPASAPTFGSGEPGFEMPGFSDAPTPTSVDGVFPSNSAVPSGGVTTPATTAPATLPTSGGDSLSSVSFVLASSSAESPVGGFPGFGQNA